ncbi:hypothetical protein SAMN02745246_01668 [Leeuwenhoekiella marinoflava DSM 3653]|uniref:Uncharacterized protein n=2 Tax=Leeuwenhoekiella marinoflava TaxID=988 RepID=A0A4Q0PPG7_9FLAO|nr:hypothetical protein DSL99_1513 [Leeuwenhoekiella marinoflava]SHF08370.1 hypothetical protein SAMN02745246_01668 [Leeuwenhoekiella marinoflava DSM 3653]
MNRDRGETPLYLLGYLLAFLALMQNAQEKIYQSVTCAFLLFFN